MVTTLPQRFRPGRRCSVYPESPMRFFVLDGPLELSFILDSRQNVTGIEFITPMGHHRLDKSAARRCRRGKPSRLRQPFSTVVNRAMQLLSPKQLCCLGVVTRNALLVS